MAVSDSPTVLIATQRSNFNLGDDPVMNVSLCIFSRAFGYIDDIKFLMLDETKWLSRVIQNQIPTFCMVIAATVYVILPVE